jgi:hypothetical protein
VVPVLTSAFDGTLVVQQHSLMAKTTTVHIIDDLDGSRNAREVSFAFDGVEYAIDLNDKNRKKLVAALRPYMEAGRKLPRRPSGRRAVSNGTRRNYSHVREWARGQGLAVSERGRVPKSVVEQYDAAH